MTRPSGARSSSVGSTRRVPGAVRDGEDVTESVRGGLVRSEQTEVRRVAAITSRRKPPSTRVASLNVVPGFGTSTAYVTEVGQRELVEQHAAVRVRIRAHAPLADRRERAQLGPAGARIRRTAPPAGSCASSVSRISRWSGVLACADPTGTWCERQVPSTCTPSTSRGPVQPFGVRSTIIGQRGPLAGVAGARRLLDRMDLVERFVEQPLRNGDGRRREGRRVRR